MLIDMKNNMSYFSLVDKKKKKRDRKGDRKRKER